MRLAHEAHVIPPIVSSIGADFASVLIVSSFASIVRYASVGVGAVVVAGFGLLRGDPGVPGVHRELGGADLAAVLEVQVEPVGAGAGRPAENVMPGPGSVTPSPGSPSGWTCR